jgi:hypothetical protein
MSSIGTMRSTEKRGQATVFPTDPEAVPAPTGMAVSIVRLCLAVAAIAAPLFAFSAHAAAEDDLVGVLTAPLARNFVNDWRAIEKLRHLRWAPLPPNMLQNCLPDGGCFTREGMAEVAGRKLTVVTTGARTMVGNFYWHNTGAPFGEEEVLAALQRAGFSAELKRCPVPGGAGSMNWYRLASARSNSAHLSIQTRCKGQPCERFVVLPGPELPALQPQQLKMYSEQCSGPAADRKPVSTIMPHELLAKTLVALMPSSSGSTLYDWKSLTSASTGIKWHADGAKKGNLSFKNDTNPWSHQGEIDFFGRHFNLFFGGSPAQVLTAYLDEGGSHPRGEDLLAVLRAQGLTVQLVRCGPIYTESINNWYRVSGPATRTVMLRQSLSFDGSLVNDNYGLRFDATLPKRDPRDRDAGVAGCK